MKHTKGPWGIGSPIEGRGAHLYSTGELRTVAWVEPWPDVRCGAVGHPALTPIEENPDLRMMAAAPELYAALRELAFYFQDHMKSSLETVIADRVHLALRNADGGDYDRAMGKV